MTINVEIRIVKQDAKQVGCNSNDGGARRAAAQTADERGHQVDDKHSVGSLCGNPGELIVVGFELDHLGDQQGV